MLRTTKDIPASEMDRLRRQFCEDMAANISEDYDGDDVDVHFDGGPDMPEYEFTSDARSGDVLYHEWTAYLLGYLAAQRVKA